MKFHMFSISEILHFDEFLLSKSCKVSAKKVKKNEDELNKNYILKSLKKNWVVVSNVTWGIWWIYHPTTQKSEYFFLMGSEELFFMTLNSNGKFE